VATALGTVSIVVDAIVPVYRRAIVTKVATGAIRLVDRCRPVHGFRIALVATRAGEITAVIQRLIAQPHVLVDMRSPSIGRMAVIALKVCHKVPLILAGRRVPIMAGRTGTQDLGVVHGCHRYPGDRGVTVLTDVCCQDMRRVLTRCLRPIVTADAVVGDIGVVEGCRRPGDRCVAVIAVIAAGKVGRVLAFGDVAIMAGEAGANNLGVIDHVGRRKGHVVVAVLADIGRIDMRWILARCIGAVMAADAVVGEIGVIEVGRDPPVGCMAVVAVITAGDMGRVLAFGDVAIMAGEAGANNLGVIDHVGWRKGHVVMAVLADIRCVDMRRILAGRIGAVMAADAVVGDIGVIEVGRDPPAGCMAVVAVITAGDMGRVLAFGDVAIMAGEAGANNLGVIHEVGGYKRHDIVAVFADHGGVNVCRTLPDGLDAIMTARAVPADAGVVKIGGRPAGRRVTVVAIVAA